MGSLAYKMGLKRQKPFAVTTRIQVVGQTELQ
jgi:hypothetical protein